MPNLLLSLGPEPAGTPAAFASQLLDEFPVIQGEAPEGALGHAMSFEEHVDFGEDVAGHAASYMRVSTRASRQIAGSVPLLRGATRTRYNPAMGQAPQIDLGKLRALIINNTGEGKPFTRRALSLAATDGRNPDLVRDIMRTGKQSPTLGSAAGICAALGVDLSEVVKGVQVATEAEEWLTVCRTVNAGVWREHSDWNPDDIYEVKVGAPMVDGDRYGAIVEGRSMEKTLPPGTILECVKVIGSQLTPQDGDYVIVERRQGDLRELTCKRLHVLPNGAYELHVESWMPEFSKPIYIGKPNKKYMGENETSIIAVVVRAHLTLFKQTKRKAKAA